jgi:tetratricopeptide (TPR) repeat protein
MKALEKDRNRRYETANGFAQDVERYLRDEPVQACPPSAWYRFRKFTRRNKGPLAVAAGLFLAVTLIAGAIGWAVRDRETRVAESARAEITRRDTVAGEARDSLKTARTLLAENKMTAARQKLAEARARLGNDRAAFQALAAEVEAGEAELDRYQQFLSLIDRAHEAETAPILQAALAEDGSGGRRATPPPAANAGRRPGEAVPFLLQAMELYAILERDDWISTVKGSFLGTDQVEHIRRLVYEELLWLADDVLWRGEEHSSSRKLSPHAAAQAALAYLSKAANAHQPTQAFYLMRAACHKGLGEEKAAEADMQKADETRPTLALDHYLRGRAAFDARDQEQTVEALEEALRLEPTHYWSMMKLGGCLLEMGQGPADFLGAARVFTGCIMKRPDHHVAYYGRGAAYYLLRRYDKAVIDLSRAIELDPKFAMAWYNRGVAQGKMVLPHFW